MQSLGGEKHSRERWQHAWMFSMDCQDLLGKNFKALVIDAIIGGENTEQREIWQHECFPPSCVTGIDVLS